MTTVPLFSMSRECAHPECTHNASARCLASDGPFCGGHCPCAAHSRRAQRPGPRRGAPSHAARQLSRKRHDAERILSECVDFILNDNTFCVTYRLHGRTSVLKFVIAVCVARLSWDDVAPDCHASTAILWTALSDMLGPTRLAHVTDCLRGTVDRALVQHLGEQILLMWARSTPTRADLLRMTTRSAASTSTRERSPMVRNRTGDEETSAQASSWKIVLVGSGGVRYE